MRLATFRRLIPPLLLAGAILSVAGAAQPPGKADKPADKKADAPLELPPGAIIAVYEKFDDALKKMPRAILLSPEKYQEMIDEIARLRKLVDRPRTRTPSKCLLKGKIDGGIAVLQAQFEFVTEKPREVVRLGCGLGQATGISLDGRTPQLFGNGRSRPVPAKGRPGDEDEGFTVHVEKPGDHQLTLDLVLGPAAQGFTLDLPRAAITRVELGLPAGASDVRVAGKALAETLLTHKDNLLAGSLGAADRLDLTWKSAQAGSARPILAADGDIQVRLDKTTVTTEAKLTLRVLGGQPRSWSLLVPRKADVKVAGDEGRTRIDKSDQPLATLCKIQPGEPTTDPIVVTITHTQPIPKPLSNRIPIGPFTVLEAVRQSGNVLVSNTVAGWHLEFPRSADLARRDVPERDLRQNPSLVAAFRYGLGTGTPAAPRPGPVSWLDVQIQTVLGQIKTRSAHVLRLSSEGDGARSWQIQTTIAVTPRWPDNDHFMVRMPLGCEYTEGSSTPPDRVQKINYDPTTRLVEVKLARVRGESPQAFSVKLSAQYSVEFNPAVAGRGRFPLPRTQGTIEQDGSLTVQAPANLELLPEVEPAELDQPRQSTHELAWRCLKRCPERIEVSWRPYRPPVSVSSLVDVTLGIRQGRASQELKYQLPDSTPTTPTILLRVPAAAANLRVVRGAEEIRGPGWGPGVNLLARRGAWQTVHVRPTNPRQPAVVLEYDFSLPDIPTDPKDSSRFTIPVVVPDTGNRVEMRVRVWSEAGLPLPSLAAGPGQPAPSEGWSEQNIEEVPGHPRLPVLVLRSVHPLRPLVLLYGQGSSEYTVLIERALVRVDIGDGGRQNYRISYRLSRLAARHLDFELPAPVPTISLVAHLDGKRINPELLLSENRPDLKGRLARLRLPPKPNAKPAILELAYQLEPDRTGSTPISTSLSAPVLIGDPGYVPTRWQIVAPPSWVVVSPEAGAGTPRLWGRRGWLAAPRVNLSGADLERWLLGGEPPAAVVDATASLTPTLVLWRDGTPTVQLLHAPQQAWLLTCSLVLVLLGLMLSRLPFGVSGATGGGSSVPRTHSWAWLLLAVLVVALVLVVLLWPTLAGQVAYGCQPGAAVLLLLALVQWVLHERYRRQIFFLPSFSRATPSKSDSVREVPRQAAHGEPSTVDAPQRSGSSIDRL